MEDYMGWVLPATGRSPHLISLLVVSIAVSCALRAAGAQYHDEVYLMGGQADGETARMTGIWLGDYNRRSSTKLAGNVNMVSSYSIQMDADNRRIIFGARDGLLAGPPSTLQSGIFRFDPATQQVTTLRASTLDMFRVNHLLINQDGDYVYTAESFVSPGPIPVVTHGLFKLSRTGAVTTLLTTPQVGAGAWLWDVGINMDTGTYLLNANLRNTLRYGVLDVALDGSSFTTFAGSTSYGWDGRFDTMHQDFATGDLFGQTGGLLFQLKKGGASRTTLWRLGYPGPFHMEDTSRFDLQSAARKRLVSIGWEFQSPTSYPAAVFFVDTRPPYAVTATNIRQNQTSPSYMNWCYSLDFYRGRHIQTMKTGRGRWDIHLSCPRFPGKSYALLMSLAGYRPGITLPDGRRIYLNLDPFLHLSLRNLLRPYFDPGPLKLDASGEAVGRIDVSALPPLNLPVWIALAVLDGASPSGVAYLPDTYVIRL